MSHAQCTVEGSRLRLTLTLLTRTSIFPSRWAFPLRLLAQGMLAYILIGKGIGKIGGYAGVADDMRALGVDGRLLPLVILTELGGGLLVLFGLKTRWAVIALFDFCLLMTLIVHTGADQPIELQKNVAMAGGILALALLGPDTGRWTRGAPAPSNDGRCGRR
jgi:putative oxidoreductase